MKRSHCLATCLPAALFVGLLAGAARPNFSGSWVLDRERSFSNPEGLDQSMAVVHTGDEVRLEAKLTTKRDGERAVQEAWTVDGIERDFAPLTAGAKGKRKAYWLPEDRGIVVEEVTTSDGPSGPVTQRVVRKWTLSSNGTTLTVDYYIDTPRGSGEARRVFRKSTDDK